MLPSKLNYVKDEMSHFLHVCHFKKDLMSPAIAYTLFRTESDFDSVFQIFVNSNMEQLSQFLYVHECSHILFGHTLNFDVKNKLYLDQKFKPAFDPIQKETGLDYSDYPYLKNYIVNVCMDFEVNSRMFTDEEWIYMQEQLGVLLKYDYVKGFHPVNFGYPAGLNWNEYLTIILKDKKSLLQFLKLMRHDDFYTFYGREPLLSPKQFDKKLNDAEKEWRRSGPFSDLDKKMLQQKSESLNPISSNHHSYSRGPDPASEVEFDSYNSMDDLLHKLKELLITSEKGGIKRDSLYNYNRRKYGTNIIIPKNLTQKRYTTTRRLFVLIDVSGSIAPSLFNDFCSTFKMLSYEFGSTTLVSWNTGFVAQWKIGDPTPNKIGGGTNLAPGINYIRNTFSPKRNDAFVLVSDFYDNLEEWEQELKNMRCQKFAIQWTHSKVNINPGFDKILKNSNS